MKYEGLSEELVQRLENLPPDEPRSKLEPLRELILRWRQQGRSYRRIQQLLREKCQVDVAYETLRRFVQRRERPHTPEPSEPAPPAAAAATVQANSQSRRSNLQSFRGKPALPPRPAVLEEFHYDPDQPLTLDPSIKD